MNTYYIRTYGVGSYTKKADSILDALTEFLRDTGYSPTLVHTVINAVEEGR